MSFNHLCFEMDRKLLMFILISTISLSGCSTYRIVKIEEGKDLNPGYHVLRRNIFIDEFVVDDSGDHPQDLSIAQERLRRRKKTVEEWYRKYNPDILQEHPLVTFSKAIIFLPLFPLFLITEGWHSPHIDKEKYDNQTKEYHKAKQEIMEFIKEDCKKEVIK